MKKMGSETWVGIFVILGILLLVLMTLKIEKFQYGKEAGYLLNIYFDSASGLDRSSPVRVAGVHVGNVEKVMLEQGKAKVIFRIPHNIVLYKDAKAYLKSEGFLGEKYVEITPGTQGAQKLEPEGVVEQGAPPADIEQFLSNMSGIRDDLKEVVKPLGEVLKAVDAKKVEGMVSNFSQFSGQLTGLANDSKETIKKAKDAFSHMEDIGDKIKKGEGTLGKLITDEAVYQEAKKTVETVKEAAASAKKTMDTLKDVSEKIERGEGTLGKLINDESLYQKAMETVQSTNETMQSAKEAIQTVKGIAEKVDKGEGTLGKLVNDESLYQTVRGIAEKVDKGEGTLGKLVNDDTLMKETEKTLKKIQKAADGLQEQTPITVLGTIIGIFF